MPESPVPPREPTDDELLFRTSAAAMPQIVWSSATNVVTNYLTPTWYAFTGRTPSLLGGAAWDVALPPDEQASVLATYRRVLLARAAAAPRERRLPLAPNSAHAGEERGHRHP
jgi:PAS domain-containing protein